MFAAAAMAMAAVAIPVGCNAIEKRKRMRGTIEKENKAVPGPGIL